MADLIEVGGQYVNPEMVIAVITPTSAHVPLVDGVDMTLRSVLLMSDGHEIPCEATPRTAVRQLKGEDASPKAQRDKEAADKAARETGGPGPVPTPRGSRSLQPDLDK